MDGSIRGKVLATAFKTLDAMDVLESALHQAAGLLENDTVEIGNVPVMVRNLLLTSFLNDGTGVVIKIYDLMERLYGPKSPNAKIQTQAWLSEVVAEMTAQGSSL